MNKAKRLIPIVFILLVAFWLRTALLHDLPPGLTHDEANHGREALGILDGVFLFYFPLNYGSEPFYSYTVAGLMGLVGESLFALRLVNVLFGTAVLPLTYLWAKRVFNHPIALLGMGLMAFTFWPLASSRQALRAGMLPFFFGLAVLCFWQLLQRSPKNGRQRTGWIIGFGVCIGLTLHIYLASRVAWLLFPVFVGYLFLLDRPKFHKMWRPTLLGLGLTAVLITPMFLYLQQNPYALTRLDMLDSPLQQLLSGNFAPVLQNVASGLLAFIWPGQGDQFLAYNIPGRPVFDGVTAVFFVIGVLVCVWSWKRPSYAFVLLWFVIGIAPSLLTGATANTTRNLAALASVHLLPAIGFYHALLWGKRAAPAAPRQLGAALAALWLLFVGWQTSGDYFVRWANDPDVRGAYQRNLVESLDYVNATEQSDVLMISTVYPGPVHDASIHLVLTAQQPQETRWMDARYALLLPPAEGATAVIPQSTAPHPYFEQWLEPVETVALRPSDLDPQFTYYQVQSDALAGIAGGETAVNFNNALTLHHASWLQETAVPGEVAELLTVWQINDPTKIGPIVPPTFTTDVAMFAQVLSNDGVLAQRDALDAPSWNWQTGDWLVQIQPIVVPETAVAGEYTTVVGFYDRTSEQRTPVLDADGNVVADFATVKNLTINSVTK